MHVGISLLTLSPGEQGGAETYARQLLRGTGRRRDVEVHGIRPGGHTRDHRSPRHDRRPHTAARAPGPAEDPRDRDRRPGLGELQEHLREIDVVHYPLTVPVPRTRRVPRVVTLHDFQHHDFPELFSRSRRAFRRRAYDRSSARSRGGDRRERVRARTRSRPTRARRLAGTRHPARRRARRLQAVRRAARAVPPLPRAALDAQEPRALAARRSSSFGARARTSARADRRRPRRVELVPDGVELLGSCIPRRARRPLPTRRLPRLPEPVRGVRPARARGDGLRLPRGCVGPGRHSRGVRRCCGALRPGRRSMRSRTASAIPTTWPIANGRERSRARTSYASAASLTRRLHVGGDRPSPRERVPPARPVNVSPMKLSLMIPTFQSAETIERTLSERALAGVPAARDRRVRRVQQRRDAGDRRDDFSRRPTRTSRRDCSPRTRTAALCAPGASHSTRSPATGAASSGPTTCSSTPSARG